MSMTRLAELLDAELNLGLKAEGRWTRADVCTGMQAAYGATVYDIKAVLPQGKEWLDLVCEVLQ